MKLSRLPRQDQLASLAAIVAGGVKVRPAKAVAYALELWRETESALTRCANAEGKPIEYWGPDLRELEANFAHVVWGSGPGSRIPKPDKFPATLADFFRLIVKAKTPADCTARFRQYLRDRRTFPQLPSWFHRLMGENIRDEKSGDSLSAKGDPTARIDITTSVASQIQKIKDADKTGGYFTPFRWIHMGQATSDGGRFKNPSKPVHPPGSASPALDTFQGRFLLPFAKGLENSHG